MTPTAFDFREAVYGQHLCLRLGGIARRSALDDVEAVRSFLVELVRSIGMRILAGPLAERESGPEEKRGCSAVVILYESHAAIHTYAHRGEAFLDVFSCRRFDTPTVLRTLERFFGRFEVLEETCEDRGRHWNTDPADAMVGWKRHRSKAGDGVPA